MYNRLIDIVAENIYCIGDIHGNFNAIRGFIKQNDICNSLLIFCGDCGFGFESEAHYKQTIFPKLSKLIGQKNDYCVFVAGNHDDHSIFNSFKFNYKRIKVVPDYTVINTYYNEDKAVIKHSILCVGGATSIDRSMRISTNDMNIIKYQHYHNCTSEEAEKLCPKCYWADEQPIYDEEQLKLLDKEETPIDIVCTHTAPSFCKPYTKDGLKEWLEYDKKLDEDLDRERNVMDNIFNYLTDNGFSLYKWCYGHFHFHNVEYIKGVKFCLMDMDRYGKLDYEEII
jgi:UDP-2,3-diacylglucosamine pyrophosphatase LpxH